MLWSLIMYLLCSGELDSRKWKMKNIILVHMYVKNMEDFVALNAVYKKHFDINPPARSVQTTCSIYTASTCISSSCLFSMWLSFTTASFHQSILLVFPAGFVCRRLCLLLSCCRWTACSMTGLSPWRRAASTTEKLCTSRACPTGRRPASDPTARPWE